MLNINDLEIRQKRYKLKSYTPFLTIIISLVIISISAIFLFNYNSIVAVNIKEDQKNTKDQKIEIEQIIKNKNDINNTRTAEVNTIKENIILVDKQEEEITVIDSQTLKIFPSMNFIQNLQSNTDTYYEDNNDIQKKSPDKPTVQKPTIQKETPVKEKEHELTINKKNLLNIKRKDDNSDIQDVINRFQVNNNPALSLFVAKKYYQLGDYDKAYNYALITNNINNNIEDSWIIFAKSLVKLNKRDMAIQTLKKYVDYSHSSQAKVLLDEILSEKFK